MDRHFISNIDDAFLAKYFAGELSKDQEKEVVAWAALDRTNQELFNKSEMTWKKTGEVGAEGKIPPRDVEAAWSKLKSRMDKVPQLKLVREDDVTNLKVDKNIVLNVWLKVAAGIALLIGVYGTVSWLFNKDSTSKFYAETIKDVLLPDSSVVTLNKNASIEIIDDFMGKERRLALKGEAFFNVKKNKSKPFSHDRSDSRWCRGRIDLLHG